MNFLKALRLPQIALLWVGQVLSSIGDYLYNIAVIWIAIDKVGSAAGLVAGAGALTTIVCGLFGGVFADRWNRRYTMILVDLASAGIVLALPVLSLSGRLQFWHLVVVEALISALGALFDPALQASLPALTGDTPTLQATNGLMDITRRLARMLGPSMTGLLLIFLPLAHFFTLDALSFALSALAVFALGTRFAWKAGGMQERKRQKGFRSILSEIAEVLRLVRGHRVLVWSLGMVTLSNLVWGVAFVVGVPLLVKYKLGNSVGAYGLIVGAYGVGNVLSNLVIGSLSITRKARLIFLGKIIMGLGFLLLGFSTSVPMALVASALAAVGGPMGDLVILTMLQTDLPAEQIGKASSLRMVLESAGYSLGLLLAIPLYPLVGVPLGMTFSASLLLLAGVAGLLLLGQREAVPTLETGSD